MFSVKLFKKFPYISVLFSILCLIVFVFQQYFPATWLFGVKNFAFYPFGFQQSFFSLLGMMSLFTYAFFHYNAYHFMTNLFLFISFGVLVEEQLKSSSFLLLIFLSALSSVLGQFFYNPLLKVYVIGASGVIASLAGFIFADFFKGKNRNIRVFLAKILLFLIWGYFQLNILGKTTSWIGHLVGFITGVLSYFLLKKRSSEF